MPETLRISPRPSLALSSVLVLALSALAPAAASEKKILLKNAPVAVQKTISEHLNAGKLLALNVEVEDGKTEYEAEISVDGHPKTVVVDGAGTLLEIETPKALSALPEVARAGLLREAGRGSISEVEEVTRGGIVSYEAMVKGGGQKRREILVGADGRLIVAKK